MVCWHVTVDIELHTVFLQHNGLVYSREHRTFELHTSQPICTTCNESTHKHMFSSVASKAPTLDLHKTHICIHIAQDFGYSLSISTGADTRSTLFFGQSVILICTEPSPYLPNLPVLHCQAINLLRICKSRVKHIVHIQLYGPRLVHSSVMGQPYSCTIKRHF